MARIRTAFAGALVLALTRSRERQARLLADLAENERVVALRGFTQQFYAARAQVESATARITLAREGVT